MKKIKIIFSSSDGPNLFFLSPIHWFLKMYHENFGKSKNQYNWTTPDIIFDNRDLNQSKLLDKITEEKIDILAFSMYSWNRNAVLNLCKSIKKIDPNIILVVGGPDVDGHKNQNFVKDHPYIDYTIYGDGEVAFSRLLDMIGGFNVSLVNLVDNLGKVYPHEVFLDKTALKKSPYIEYQEEFVDFFLNLQDYITTTISENLSVVIVWETTKGCPYACSFCDWSSGLHNKVRIWGINSDSIPNWQKEVKLFFKLNELLKKRPLSIYWTNPNIGLARQDEEIIDYWANLKKQLGKGPIIQNPQLSKLKKDVTFRILDKMIDSGITKSFKFDLQDLDEVVLTNVNRPEIPWEEHKKYILNLKSKYQDIENLYIHQRNTYANRITFIWGLPGQTLEHLKFNIIESGTVRCFGHNLPFELLPNSPAYNDEYIKKFKIKFRKIEILDQNSLSKIKTNTTTCIEKAVTEHCSITEYDYVKGIILYNIYSFFYSDYHKSIFGLEYKIFDNAHKIENIIQESYKVFLETGMIGLIDDSEGLVSISKYFYNNKRKMYGIFEFPTNNF
jgi:putative methyltransferase